MPKEFFRSILPYQDLFVANSGDFFVIDSVKYHKWFKNDMRQYTKMEIRPNLDKIHIQKLSFKLKQVMICKYSIGSGEKKYNVNTPSTFKRRIY